MKAAYFMRHGGPEVMNYGDVPDPVAGPGEIVVDVHAASVNGADWKVRAGGYRPVPQFPYIPGRDFSGVVAALGPGVKDLRVGDAVFGVCDVGQEAAYAEKIAIKRGDRGEEAGQPDAMSECAALALIGLTALVAVEDTLKLKSGETILIQGGAGGVAGFAIQLAKHIGAQRDLDRERGESRLRARSRRRPDDRLQRARISRRCCPDCDAVFDTVGGEVAQRAFAVLKPGGRAAFIASGGKAPASPRADVKSLRPDVKRDRPHLERIVELVAKGAVTPPEITRYPLSQAAEAHRVSEGRHLRGKLVFTVR